jgi:hypothetical protein
VPGYGTVTLTFQPPPEPPEGPVTGYEVSLDDGVTWQPVTTTTAAGGRLKATLTGLTDGATYSLLVRAQSSAGPGAPSAVVEVTLPLSIVALITPPQPPASPVSHRVVKIHWAVPAGKVNGRFRVTRNGLLYAMLPVAAREVTVSFVGMKGPAVVRVRVSTRAITGVTLATTRTFHICWSAPIKPRMSPSIPLAW